jgi:hypothetical protein
MPGIRPACLNEHAQLRPTYSGRSFLSARAAKAAERGYMPSGYSPGFGACAAIIPTPTASRSHLRPVKLRSHSADAIWWFLPLLWLCWMANSTTKSAIRSEVRRNEYRHLRVSCNLRCCCRPQIREIVIPILTTTLDPGAALEVFPRNPCRRH